MTLNPFVMGSASKPSCFDEKSPCILEQTSMCVIKTAQDADKNGAFPGQSVYVPWLVCMDSRGDRTSECNKQVGVNTAAVNACLNGAEAKTLLQKYISVDAPIRATPTVQVNGKKVRTSYSAIKTALCHADSSLHGCAAPMPDGADREVVAEPVPLNSVLV
jgi:hypothetical protein